MQEFEVTVVYKVKALANSYETAKEVAIQLTQYIQPTEVIVTKEN